MILDCPSCATRFTIRDDVLAAGSRKVRCAKCQHVWDVGKPDTDAAPMVAPVAALPSENFAAALAVAAVESVPMAATRDNPVSVTPESQWTKPAWRESLWFMRLQAVARHLAMTPRQAMLVSAVLLVAIIILGAVAPHTLAARSSILAHFFAALGVHHESAQNQLDIQLTRAEKCLISGRDMLCIEGRVTHEGHQPLTIPPIYVTALNIDGKEFTDADGHPILTWTVQPGTGKLLAGETRPFSLTEPYPDQAINDFDYGFSDDEHETPH